MEQKIPGVTCYCIWNSLKTYLSAGTVCVMVLAWLKPASEHETTQGREHLSRTSEYKQRRLDEWETELPPCLTERPHPSFIENQIPHHQHHDRNINSQASQGAFRSLYLFSATTKESRFCFVYRRWVNLQRQRCFYRSDSIQLGL